MKVAMISPNLEKEKAIAYFSEKLINSVQKSGAKIDNLTYTAGSLKSFLKIIPKLKNYDVVHVQHEYNLLGGYGIPFFFAYLSLLLSKEYKIITTMHTVLSKKEKFEGPKIKSFLRKSLYFFQNRWINWISDYIVVHQNFFIDILGEYGVPKEKIFVLRQGIVDDLRLLPKQKARKELKLSGNVYLIIGNLHFVNGADRILKRADKMGKTILVATNPGSVNDRNVKRLGGWIGHLQEIVKKNKFEKYVRFDLKEIPFDLWWKYLSAADLVLLPYRGGIGSGIFTDAMATKKPVVSSNIPFFKEIKKNYDCVKIAKEDKDFPKVISEAMKPEEYKKMVKGCRSYFRDNNWTEIGKRYKKLYFSLIK